MKRADFREALHPTLFERISYALFHDLSNGSRPHKVTLQSAPLKSSDHVTEFQSVHPRQKKKERKRERESNSIVPMTSREIEETPRSQDGA